MPHATEFLDNPADAAPWHLEKDIGVLTLANTLAQEYYNGKPIRNLEPREQQDLLNEARDRIAHYLEQ